MNGEFLKVLRDPVTSEQLAYILDGKREYLSTRTGPNYEIKNDIVCFLREEELTGNNARFRKLYDRLAPFYDLSTQVYARFKKQSVHDRLMEYLDELEIRDGDKVIEISVGTGSNLLCLTPNASYYGVDISFGMLNRCRKAMRKDGREVYLMQAEAERLPLADGAFDVVFSAGGFNFFNDRDKAISEMLRIAKSGSKLMISDETEKVRAKFEKSPVAKNFYRGQKKIEGPAGFVPDCCREVKYKEVCDGELYALTFRKP